MRLVLSFIVTCWLVVNATVTQAAVTQKYRTIKSTSGQFSVGFLEQFRVPPHLLEQEKAQGIIVLNPELLTVSAERIKSSLLRQLGTSDRYRGKVRFQFTPGKSDPDLFFLQSTRFTSGWSYQITLSPKIKRSVFLRGTVAVLLLEMANRLATERTTEIPFWLVHGLTTELQESALVDLTPSHTDRITIGGTNPLLGAVTPIQQRQDPILMTRQYLAQNVAASISELFIPEAVHLKGEKKTVFDRSAHFFVRQLLALPAGQAGLQQFLSGLASHLNWQHAFFPSFSNHFGNMLELEKWWSVALTDLTHLAPIGSWTLADSHAYLQRIITPSALVGQNRTELAQRTDFTLQQVMEQWDYDDQRTTLQQVVNRLRVLSVYAHPTLNSVILEYVKEVDGYLTRRNNAGYQPSRRGQVRQRAPMIIRDAQKKLNALDSIRKSLLPSS